MRALGWLVFCFDFLRPRKRENNYATFIFCCHIDLSVFCILRYKGINEVLLFKKMRISDALSCHMKKEKISEKLNS